MSAAWVVSFGDTHCGLRLGLALPDTELHEEGPDGQLVPFSPTLTETQRFLLQLYTEQVQAVAEITAGEPLVLIHGGDMCHGDRHPGQLMSTRISDQVFVAADVLRVWRRAPNLAAVRMVLGTEAHNAGEGSLEHLVAGQVADDLPDVQVASHWRLEIAGAVFDIAHHGPGVGGRYWLDGNGLGWYLRDVALRDAVEEGIAPPAAVLRFHYHTYNRATHFYGSPQGLRPLHGIIHPAYCGMNFHGQKATRSRATTHYGMILWHVVDGEIVEIIDRLVVRLDRRTQAEVVL